jgi:hypothetical protein
MVCYKRSCSPIQQYLPIKPKKWKKSFWILADSIFKSIYCFEIYCGKNLEVDVRMKGPCREVGAAYRMVMKMLYGLERNGHCAIIDNYFCSTPHFQNLVQR